MTSIRTSTKDQKKTAPLWLDELSQNRTDGYPHRRMRRLREKKALRHLTQEHHLHIHDLVAPLFVMEGRGLRVPLKSLPRVARLTLDEIEREVDLLAELGLQAIALFPCIEESQKDPFGSLAFQDDSLVVRAIELVKKVAPHLCIISDVALDPFTNHSHDGLIDDSGRVVNDATVEKLMELSLLYAEAGVDVIAPSDMMDGRVAALRRALDAHGFEQVCILSYAAKFSSTYYSPFREAVGSKLLAGDKLGYQLNPANVREALLDCRLDEEEGADLLMVKPALPYLDVIYRLRQQSSLPIVAFHVSGELALIEAAAEKGLVERERMLFEQLISIKRAGADIIFTWGAADMARWLC